MACHFVDLPFWALELRHPTGCEAEGPPVHPETCPLGLNVQYAFPSRGDLVATKLTWYDGGKRPDPTLLGGIKPDPSGALIIGDQGRLYSTGDYADKYQMLDDLEEPAVEIEKSPGHFVEWVNAIKGEKPATSNFPDYAGPLTETILLGNLAVWVGDGKRVEWDAENLKCTNMPELASIVKREYREGYSL